MTTEILEIIVDSAAVLLAGCVVVRTIPCLRASRRQLTAAQFLFAIVSLLLTYAYWLAYSLMRPDVRMPLAANMIGECAVFLLLSAALDSVFREGRVPARAHILCTLIYAAASVALWVAWSGEWIQDVIGGVVYGYFLCVCVRTLKQTGALTKREWIVLGVSCALIIAAWIVWFFVPEELVFLTLIVGYGLIYATTAYFLIKTYRAVRRSDDPDLQLSLSVSSHAWCMGAMYMTSGYYYNVAMILCLLTLPLMMIAVKREVEAA